MEGKRARHDWDTILFDTRLCLEQVQMRITYFMFGVFCWGSAFPPWFLCLTLHVAHGVAWCRQHIQHKT